MFLGAATIGTLATGSGQSEQWNATVDRVRGSASTKQAAGGSVTMSWTVTGGATERFWAIAAVPIGASGCAYDLTVAIDPAGGGTTNGRRRPSLRRGSLVPVTATAQPATPSITGAATAPESGACQVTMTASKSVTAHFVQIMHDLTVAVDPAGGGTKQPWRPSYAEGSVVPSPPPPQPATLRPLERRLHRKRRLPGHHDRHRSVTTRFAPHPGRCSLDGEVDSGDALIILSCDAGINTGCCPMVLRRRK